MKGGDILLGTVFVFAVIISWLLSNHLLERQAEIALSRDQVSNMPLAGFQKFVSDIEWMRFLQYVGTQDITAETAPDIQARLMRIIRLDPDFARVYYEGALMLAPVDEERALEILDYGLTENERLRHYWRLHMLAGLIVVRPERMALLRGDPVNLARIERALSYFEKAYELPNGESALGNLIFCRAYIAWADDQDDGDSQVRPLLVHELQQWKAHWMRQSEMYEGMMDEDVGGGHEGLPPLPPAITGESGTGYGMHPVDVENRILTILQRLKNESGYADLEGRAELIESTLAEVFPGERFDPVDLRRLPVADMGSRSGTVPAGATSHTVVLRAVRGFRMHKLTTAGPEGAEVSVLIGDEPVAGFTHSAGPAPTTLTAEGDHVVNPEQRVRVAVAEPLSQPLAYTIETYAE